MFFERRPQFKWVHLTGGELFMRRDLNDLVAAIQSSCRSLYLLNLPTTGWFGDKTLALVEQVLARGVGRLMVTISLDGPKALHDEMRGLPGSFDRALETFRRLRGIRRSNFQTVIGMTLLAYNAARVDDTLAAVQESIPDFRRSELHLNIAHESVHYFDNVGAAGADRQAILQAVEEHRSRKRCLAPPGEVPRGPLPSVDRVDDATRRSPLPCTALSVVVLHRPVLEPVPVLDLDGAGWQPS